MTLVALLFTFFAAGWLFSFLLPDPIGPEKRTLLSLAISPALVIILAGFAMLVGSPAPYYILVFLLFPLAIWRMWPLPKIRFSFLQEQKFWITICWISGAFLLLCLCLLGPYQLLDVSPRLHGAIAFYHWGIVRETFWAGSIPNTLVEWNRPEPFPYEYLGSVLHGAAASFLSGDASFVFSEYYRIAMLFSVAIALYALWSRFMDRPFAWIGSLVVLSTTRFESRIDIYKPELVAVCFAIWATWLLDEAIERRSVLWGVLCGAVAGAAIIAHPVGSILLFPLFLAILLARFIQNRRLPWRTLIAGGAVAVAIAASGMFLFGQTEQDLQQTEKGGVDQSVVLYNLAFALGENPPGMRGEELRLGSWRLEAGCWSPLGYYQTASPFQATPLAHVVLPTKGPNSWVVPFLLAITLLGSAMFFAGRTQRAIIFISVYLLLLGSLVYVICGYYDTWVPERVGPGRVAPYWPLALGGGVAGIVSAICAPLKKRRGAVAAALAVPVLILFTPVLRTEVDVNDPEPSRNAYAALKWIKGNTDRNSVILINAHTEGGVGAITGRKGLLDGRTPFVQPDPWRSRAIELLKDSRMFFLTGEQEYLDSSADYVVALRGKETVGQSRFPIGTSLGKVPFLALVFERDGVRVYKIVR